MQAVLPEGFTTRAATMDDLETAVELFARCAVDQIGVNGFFADEIKIEWETPKRNLTDSTRIVFSPDGKLVGYIEVWDISEPPVRIWVWGRVHPEYENLGIGTWLTSWAEQRARQAIPRAPEDARVVMQSGGFAMHQPSLDFHKNYGMVPIRHFWRMTVDLHDKIPASVFPDGITIQTLRERPNLRQVYEAVDDAFQDHWGYVQEPAEVGFPRFEHWATNDEKLKPEIWFLAMDGDEIAGVSLCRTEAFDDPEMGWVEELGVRRPWRRQGLALALLHHTFRELRRLGKLRCGLGVDAGSLTGATRLYEKAGMQMDERFSFLDFEKELRAGRDLMRQTLEK